MKSLQSLNSIMDTLFLELKLYRVFDDVKEESIGGWIEKESNLDQDGNCWIYDDAKVYDDARITGSAKVYDDARITGSAIINTKP